MNRYLAEVKVWLKPSVFDPQGNAVEHALHTLGFEQTSDVRIGKLVQLQVEAAGEAEAEKLVHNMCDTLLCNPVMEGYTFELKSISAATNSGKGVEVATGTHV